MKKVLLFITLSSAVFVGCNPKYYTPNTHNVPLISEKGETNLTLSGGDDRVEFQGAMGITNGFAIKANGGLFIPSDIENGDGGSGKFLEIGGGYFTPVGNKFVFELYGIAGVGRVENHLPSTASANPQTQGDISANIFRYGIQPNFGFKTKYFTAAISSRIVNLTYNKIEGDLIYGGESQVNYLKANDSNFLLEPALTLRGGVEKIKLQLQVGWSVNMTNSEFRQDNSFATLGLNFNFKN